MSETNRRQIVDLPQIVVFFYVLFVLCRSVYCLYVNVNCTTATWCQPNCS